VISIKLRAKKKTYGFANMSPSFQHSLPLRLPVIRWNLTKAPAALQRTRWCPALECTRLRRRFWFYWVLEVGWRFDRLANAIPCANVLAVGTHLFVVHPAEGRCGAYEEPKDPRGAMSAAVGMSKPGVTWVHLSKSGVVEGGFLSGVRHHRKMCAFIRVDLTARVARDLHADVPHRRLVT
jgi:hypothetical protein